MARTSIALNGKDLAELSEDGDIILQKVTENAPSVKNTTVAFGNGIGSQLVQTTREYLQVDVEFSIKGVRRYENRASLLQTVLAWAAAGGDLTVSYRPSQVLHVILDSYPQLGSVTDWTDNYKLTFKALAVPYWCSSDVSTYKFKTNDSLNTIEVNGNTRTPLTFSIKNTNTQAIATLNVRANGYAMYFTNLALAVNESLVLDYVDGVQQLYIAKANGTKSRDAYAYRTVASADDIWLNSGKNTVALVSQRTATFTLSAEGRWL